MDQEHDRDVEIKLLRERNKGLEAQVIELDKSLWSAWDRIKELEAEASERREANAR